MTHQASKPDAAPKRATDPRAHAGPKAFASILVVDDTFDNLRVLDDLLTARGFEVRPVSSGEQAIAAAQSAPPDLVLLDINMPGLDGYEVCKRLKAEPSTSDAPVIFLTANTEIEQKVRAFEAGGVDYVTKPFRFEEVVARVETHLSLRCARRELQLRLDDLRRANDLRDKLVHMLVHDMRNLLMVVASYTDFARESIGKDPAAAREDLACASQATETATRMINDLLDVSRLEAGQMPVRRALCDVTEIARHAAKEMAALDRSATIELAQAREVVAHCDPDLVRRVLENLLSNAIKHGTSGCRVRVDVLVEGERVKVTVDDNGPGIAPELRARLFQKFVTGAGSEKKQHHSAGLGLAFCKLAVEAQGGAIGAGERPQGGSRFWFTLRAG